MIQFFIIDFEFFLNFYENSICSVSKKIQLADFLERILLIIWNKILIQNKYDFEIIYKFFQDFRNSEISFNKLSIIFGGDFA
jgi:hypothetical protein